MAWCALAGMRAHKDCQGAGDDTDSAASIAPGNARQFAAKQIRLRGYPTDNSHVDATYTAVPGFGSGYCTLSGDGYSG